MLKVYAVRDVKADAFGNLITVPTKGLAVRVFIEACSSREGALAQYPDDYSLYELGEYDPNSGTIKGLALPVLIMSANEAVASTRQTVNIPQEVA